VRSAESVLKTKDAVNVLAITHKTATLDEDDWAALDTFIRIGKILNDAMLTVWNILPTHMGMFQFEARDALLSDRYPVIFHSIIKLTDITTVERNYVAVFGKSVIEQVTTRCPRPEIKVNNLGERYYGPNGEN